MTRRCRIRGFMPAIMCGWGAYAKNYTSHLEDKLGKGPYGGGHSTMRFSLTVFYEEHLKHHNYWTYSNKDLELALYYGTTIKFYRDPYTDFIAVYNRKSPLGGNRLTGPSLHPGAMMLQKNKILIPSLQTKPKGKKTVTVNIAPPTLFTHKWYFQKDICGTTLFNLNVAAADLRFPFGSPQTDNICISFQVLSSTYNQFLSVVNTEDDKTLFRKFLNEAMPSTSNRRANILNTYKTEGNYSHPQLKKYKRPTNFKDESTYFLTPDGLWGDPIYEYTDEPPNKKQNVSQIIEIIINNAENYFKKLKSEPQITQGRMIHTHLTGMYSSTFLNPGRVSQEFPGLYTDIIYNPWVDKGTGNRVWLDSITKKDNVYTEGQSIVLLENMPLWCMLNGYIDWAKKETNNWGLPSMYRLTLVCPYTYPSLYHTTNKNYGFIPYSTTFGAGQMPDKDPYVPVNWRGKWYPHVLHQQSVIEDIVVSGPFAPKTVTPNMQLNMKYTARFKWGGNPISTQIVTDPCTQPTFDIPGGGNLPGRVQVLNPKLLGPNYSFRSFDIRRDFFSATSIKRIAQQPETSEDLFTGGKRPKIDLPKYEPPEENYSTTQREQRPWETSSESEAEAQEQEEQTTSVREQLQQQLQEQLQLRRGLKCLFEQLIRTQQGVHVNPILT